MAVFLFQLSLNKAYVWKQLYTVSLLLIPEWKFYREQYSNLIVFNSAGKLSSKKTAVRESELHVFTRLVALKCPWGFYSSVINYCSISTFSVKPVCKTLSFLVPVPETASLYWVYLSRILSVSASNVSLIGS